MMTLAISQSADADLTHLHLILRQRKGGYRPLQIFRRRTETSNGENMCMGAVNCELGHAVPRSTWNWVRFAPFRKPLPNAEKLLLRWAETYDHPLEWLNVKSDGNRHLLLLLPVKQPQSSCKLFCHFTEGQQRKKIIIKKRKKEEKKEKRRRSSGSWSAAEESRVQRQVGVDSYKSEEQDAVTSCYMDHLNN